MLSTALYLGLTIVLNLKCVNSFWLLLLKDFLPPFSNDYDHCAMLPTRPFLRNLLSSSFGHFCISQDQSFHNKSKALGHSLVKTANLPKNESFVLRICVSELL